MSYTATLPISRHIARRVTQPYVRELAGALEDAWNDYMRALRETPEVLTRASAGARGMLVADLMTRPIHQRFHGLPRVEVQLRFDRPWVRIHGDGAMVDIRFRKLTPEYALAPTRSLRGKLLALHIADPVLPGMVDTTILTAGYIVDQTETNVRAMALVCHVGDTVHYVIDLPGTTQKSREKPAQLPLMPLTAPIIRSAQKAARRLSQETSKP